MDNSNQSPFGHNMRRKLPIRGCSQAAVSYAFNLPKLQHKAISTPATASATTSVTTWTTRALRNQIKKPSSGAMFITLLNIGISKITDYRKWIQEPKAAISKPNKRGKVKGRLVQHRSATMPQNQIVITRGDTVNLHHTPD